MSTFTLASASAVSTRPAMPGRSGRPLSVMRASAVECVTAVTSGRLHGLLFVLDDGTWSVVEARSAVDRDAVVAGVLHGPELQHAGAGGRHLEHLLEGQHRQLAGVRHDPRVGAEHAGDVREDLADLGAQGGGQRHGGGVRAAAAERGHVERVLETPWKPATSTIRPSSSAVADPVRLDLEDARLRVRGVGDDAGLGAGQRDRLVPEVVDRHRRERARHALPGREQHVHLARVRPGRDLVGQRRSARRCASRARRGPQRPSRPPPRAERCAAPRS